jgi:hypothetical protein
MAFVPTGGRFIRASAAFMSASSTMAFRTNSLMLITRPARRPPSTTRVSLIVWFLAYCYGSIGFAAMGMFPARMIAIALIWGLFELVIATVAGAWVYHEAPEVRRTAPPMPV